MEPVTYIISGILIGVIGLEAKDIITKKDYVEQGTCDERRASCGALNANELAHIKETLSRIERYLKLNGHSNPNA